MMQMQSLKWADYPSYHLSHDMTRMQIKTSSEQRKDVRMTQFQILTQAILTKKIKLIKPRRINPSMQPKLHIRNQTILLLERT